jgi:hypothetical protein
MQMLQNIIIDSKYGYRTYNMLTPTMQDIMPDFKLINYK